MTAEQIWDANNEASILKKLVHPYIVRCFKTQQVDQKIHIVMEWCDGKDLNACIKAHRLEGQEDKIWSLFIEICFGLQYLHTNKILHRDMKPMNVFLTSKLQVKIGDVGEAR